MPSPRPRKSAAKKASKKTTRRATKTTQARKKPKTAKPRSTVKQRYVPSYIERRLGWLLQTMGLKYRAQYRVTRHNGRSYYLDFALPESDIAIECDGAAYHSSPAQKRRDLKRQREIENLGWQVVRFTGSQIVTDLGGCEQVLVNLLKRLA